MRRARIGALIAVLACAACGGSREESPAWFREEAHARGLDFTWRSGHAQKYYFPEIMGGGAALFDLEEDGDLDVYLVQAGDITADERARPPDVLFRNTGDGHFEALGPECGVEARGYGMGVAAGDVDDDGRTDLYVTEVGPDVLYVNRGDGRVRDATQEAGLGNPGWGTSAAFFDLDRDGDLDLYVANYVEWSLEGEQSCFTKPNPEDYCSPKSYHPAPDTLYRNEGAGVFTDVSIRSGIRATSASGLGVLCADFDGDGWQDVFVANDGMLNLLWRNQRDGSFLDAAVSAGCAVDQEGIKKAGMGTLAADVDFDGDEDLLVVNLGGERDSLFRNDGAFFSDRTPLFGLAGVSRGYTRFGPGFADFDQDGWLDLYLANGRVQRRSGGAEATPFDEPNLLLRGTAAGKFEEVLPRGGTSELLQHTSRGAALGDLDGDGAIDVVVVNRDAPAYLLRNDAPQRGHWIAFRVRERSGRDALGAGLSLEQEGRRVCRWVRSALGYCSASDPRVHLGLGSANAIPGDVTVRWVDGSAERFAGPFAAGRVHELRRGRGVALADGH